MFRQPFDIEPYTSGILRRGVDALLSPFRPEEITSPDQAELDRATDEIATNIGHALLEYARTDPHDARVERLVGDDGAESWNITKYSREGESGESIKYSASVIRPATDNPYIISGISLARSATRDQASAGYSFGLKDGESSWKLQYTQDNTAAAATLDWLNLNKTDIFGTTIDLIHRSGARRPS